jgi:hypothetical protein
LEDSVIKQKTRSLTEKTKNAAMAAGEAIGQAALNVTSLAVGQARAAVAVADRALHGVSAKPARRKKRAASVTSAKAAPKKRPRSTAKRARRAR